MIYVAVSIIIMTLVPIAGGIFYAIVKDDMYDSEGVTILGVIVGMAAAWAWPVLIPLALIAGIVFAMVAGTARLTEKIMDKRSGRNRR